MENCYNTGAVTGTGSDIFYVGGVAGYIYYSTTAENCYNTGTVSGPSGGNVGGVVGGVRYAANYPSTMKNCYFLQDTGTNTGLSGIGYDETSSTSGQSSNDGAMPKTADAFASGEVAYLLQAGQTAGEDGSIPQVWGQTLVGGTKDAAPVLTSDAAKSVVAVTFMVKSDTENGYTEHAAKYTNKGGTVALPTDPTAPATHVFSGWYTSSTALTEANRFTVNIMVTADTTVYAGMQLQYGAAEGGKTVNTTYGVGATADLSECIAYADSTTAKNNFSYTITSGNENGYFSISGDTLTVSSSTPAGTYELTITAKEKTPQISLFSTYSFGTSDVTFTVKVVVAKATPAVTAPTAQELTYTGEAQALVTAGSATGGTLQYSTDGTTYSAEIPTGTKADTYTVYYKVVGDENHSDTTAESVPVTIAKAEPDVEAPTDLTAVSGQTLASVKLPSGWTWVDDTLRVGTADTNTFSATYTPSDTDNYNTVTVDITVTIVAEVEVKPGETVEIGNTTVTNNDDGTVTVKGEDDTEITVTLPEGSDSVTVDGDENVTVPDGTTVQTGNGPEITLPKGGTVDGNGNVTGEEVQIGGTTITAPKGETVTTAPDGTTTAPGGSTVQVGETTITIGEDTNGAAVDENGKITLPSGGTVTVEIGDGEPVTITTPEGGEITVNEDEGETTLTVPDGTTVQTGDGPKITLPEGGKVAEDGSVTAETVQVGDTTITAPAGETVTTTPGGTTTAPGGSTVEIGETKITVGEDTAATVDQTGSVTLPEGGTATVKTQDGTTVTITAPEGGGTIGVDNNGNVLLPGGSTVTIGNTVSTIPESGGALDPATSQITYNTYLVTFNSQGGSQVAAQTVTAGGTVKQPASPTKTGYTFAGWYRDAACQTPWNFTTDTVTGNLTLYAKWTVKSTTPTYTPTVSQPENGTVTVTPTNPKQGATVTVTPKPNTGYEVDTITVTDKNGNPVQVTDNGDGTYRFTQPASKVTVAVTFTETKQPTPDLPFTDVDPTAWYAEAVSYMLERGLMTGTAPDTFSPNSTTTRGMIVTILYRLEGEPSAANDGTFTDVDSGTWYTDPIAWVAANGVVEGTTPTTFAPNAPVTREQMATILYRYLAAKGYDVTARADLSAYTDANQVSSYATEAMSWANALGLITGDTPATLTPQGNATRAQVATILMRFCESLEK